MEILDIVDEYGNPTGETVERTMAHAEGIPHRTAHVWLVRKKADTLEILLQKRCATKDAFPGCYDISSAGHIPAGCGYTESAVRELKEELGIDVEESELISCGDRTVAWDDCFHGVPYHDRQYSRVFLLWKDLDEDAFTLQKEELDGVLWMDFDRCVKAVRTNTIKNCIFPDELDMVKRAVSETGSSIRISFPDTI